MKSDFLISKIGIGSAQFGMSYGISNSKGQTYLEEVKKILSVCSFYKIKYIDTASGYGVAESILGCNDLNSYKVVTKFMHYPEIGMVVKQLNESLEKLNLPSIYGLLAHRPIELLSDDVLWNELVSLKEVGKVEKIGFSLNTVDEIERLLDKNRFPDIIQIPYNYFDDRFEQIALFLKNKGCEIHARSVFLQGLFFKDVETLNSFFDEIKPILFSLKESTKSLEGALLNYVLNKPFIDVVIMGIENTTQLINNLNLIGKVEHLPILNKKISEKILMPSKWITK